WVPEQGVGHGWGSGQEGRVHPLVHRNTSNLREQRFSSVFTGGEFFLADHVVQGQKVLPGVAHLELARAAVIAALEGEGQSPRIELQNVVFVRPVVVGGQGLELHIALQPDESGGIDFEIYSGRGEEAVVYSQGRAV